MKLFEIIILLILIINIYSLCSGKLKPQNADDCKNRISSEDKAAGYGYCCFYKMTVVDITQTSCIVIKSSEYENIKELIKEYESSGGTASIDCKSYNLQIGLLNTLLFLIYFLY